MKLVVRFIEVYGEENVESEEIDPKGFSCFEGGKEKILGIWVKGKRLYLTLSCTMRLFLFHWLLL